MDWLWRILRSLFFALLLVVLSLAAFYVISHYRRGDAHENELVQILRAEGQKAVSAIQNPEERARVARLLRDVLEGVERGKVDPKTSELIAARVLNLAYGALPVEIGTEELRRALILAQNLPSRPGALDPREWLRTERRVRAAAKVMAYWEAKGRAGSAPIQVPFVLGDDLRPRLNSSLLAELRELEQMERQLELARQARLEELRARQRLLDSLRQELERALGETGREVGPLGSVADSLVR